ncbi:MAG: PIG-L family deacetylase, partial [Patescibacteria group bacterium]
LFFAPILALGIAFGAVASIGVYQAQRQALGDLDQRNKVIVRTIENHRVDVLVGDYWRVLPIKLAGNSKQLVSPLADCTTQRQILTSGQWQPDLRHNSFAYLLTLDGSKTGYPHCDLSQIVAAYGLPNASALIEGTLSRPKELLLFYDRGVHKALGAVASELKSVTILPVELSELVHTDCPEGTIMNIVAHQDDDLLFMNPDLLHSVKAGSCVRSVYLTAGDAGADAPYWLSRENGSEAAYSSMIGVPSLWIQQIVRLPSGQFVTIDSPKGNDRVSLIFMHLPDGNVGGEGFGASNHGSLDSLEMGRLARLQTVDHQSSYNSRQLLAALVALMRTYRPAELRTQSDYVTAQAQDHSDHRATGRLAARAFKDYEAQQQPGYEGVPISYYMGYPIHQLEPNLFEQDYQDKLVAFMAYAAYDGGVCRSIEQCLYNPAYGAYLSRQYTNPY